MSKIIIAIDNGLFGCACKSEEDKEPILTDTPIVPVKVGKKFRNKFDVKEMVKILEQYSQIYTSSIKDPSNILAVIEQTIPMPGIASMATKSIGLGEGLWIGILATLKIPCMELSIRKWQSHFGIWGKGKETKHEAYLLASRLFPRCRLKTERGRLLDGRCDALLMAEYARREL